MSLTSLFALKNRVRIAAFVLAASWTVVAQEKDFVPPPVTAEGQFLELIDLESDPQKQLLLMDLFIKQFPSYNAMAAVYSEMQANCVKLNQFDRALELGEKLLTIDQDDAEALKLNLEAARASVLTSLGWANYKMKNIPDAIKFYEQCAAIAGPLQSAAAQSLSSIKNEYGLAQ